MERFCVARLPFEQSLDHLLEVPIELELTLNLTAACAFVIAEQLVVRRVLDQDLEGRDEHVIRVARILVLLHHEMLKAEAAHVEEHLPDASVQELTPVQLRVEVAHRREVLLPRVSLLPAAQPLLPFFILWALACTLGLESTVFQERALGHAVEQFGD